MPPEKIDSNNYEQSRRHFLKIITFSNECKAYLTLAPFTVVSAYI